MYFAKFEISYGIEDLILIAGDFKFMMHYQDHATKFCFLRPLTSKRASEVAEELTKIFYHWGAPQMLQSDNGKEFVAKVIEEVVAIWPYCKILYGRPRHPESQGSVERANGDVKSMIRAWMLDKNSQNWSRACYEVQVYLSWKKLRNLIIF